MYEPMTERGDILAAWQLVYEGYAEGTPPTLDANFIKHLVFDTYWYYRRFEQFNSVLREDLPIYRYLLAMGSVVEYPTNCEHYVLYCCNDFIAGLVWAIENGFPRRMHKIMLPLGLTYHVPAGCDPGEVDMSSYATYERAFRKELITFMREQIDNDEFGLDDEPLDEQAELRKIAATKDA